jgi:hypothetical protein
LERDNLSVGIQDSARLNSSQDATGIVFRSLAFNVPNRFSGSMRLSDFELLYPGFRAVYQKHFDDARFDLALRRDPGFESLKLRLLAVKHLEKNQRLDTTARVELIRTILIEGNFRSAQKALSGADRKRSGTVWGVGSLFSSSGSSEDSLEKEMKTLAARVPDAQFLLMIKSEGNEELRPVIDEVEGLVHSQLASSIDTVVKKMARALSAMQQERCEKAVQLEMESAERKSRSKVLMEFIQDINAQAVGRQDSYAFWFSWRRNSNST